MKLVHLFMAATVMLVANGASAESVVKPFHLDEATISDVQEAYRSGALTAARLVQAYQERFHAYDQAGPKLNVVIFLNPRALEEAAALDERPGRSSARFMADNCQASHSNSRNLTHQGALLVFLDAFS